MHMAVVRGVERPTQQPHTTGSAITENREKLGHLTLRPGLSGAAHLIFEGGQLLDAHRPARMKLARGNPNLSAHSKFSTIGKLRRRVVHHYGAVEGI